MTLTKTTALYSLFAVLAFSTGLLASGCSDDVDNVEACESWLEATSCGTTDFGLFIDCSIYEDTECDISAYFDCLTDNTTCDEATGVADVTAWSMCASKAQCD